MNNERQNLKIGHLFWRVWDSQTEIGRFLVVPQQTVCDWLRGAEIIVTFHYQLGGRNAIL